MFSPSVRRTIHHAIWLFAWLTTLGIIAGLLFFIYIQATLPDPQTIIDRRVDQSTKIYDRTGMVLLYDIYKEERRTIIPWDRIPQNVRDATVAAEDANFYNHRGIDVKGIIRAFIENVKEGDRSQGGSTITQQLIKKALLGDQKTLSRKVREAMLALEIERQFTKDQILEMYLNQIPYGSNAYGIEAASQTFFKKPAGDLTTAEAALLVALPQSPSRLSPYGSHADELYARQAYILRRMHELSFLSDEEYALAQAEKPTLSPKGSTISAPHFVIMAREYVLQKYGEETIQSGGLKIITSLDATLQKTAGELVAKHAEVNEKKHGATNAALVAIDPKTGDVLALVGSRNYFDVEREGNFNVATALRQPGSSFKPFAYAGAIQKGYPDGTILFDVKTEFNPLCSPEATQRKDSRGNDCYHPQNYDGRYRGPVSLRQSLAQSLNVTSVKTLYLAGIQETISLAERMGITTLQDRSRFGLALVLGGAEVRLIDLVSAYGVFANDGLRTPWALVNRIERADGSILEDRAVQATRALDPQAARMISDILSDNAARAPTFGASSPLVISGRQVAAKTGTTQANRDAWIVGYTPSLVVGAWAGNNDNTPMNRTGTGVGVSAPLWNEFMRAALSGKPLETFTPPDPMSSDKTMLNGLWQSFNSSSGAPEAHSILYYIQKNNPLGPEPTNPASDDQFSNWDRAVQFIYPSSQNVL
ncbi:MAG: PBP1A family penicillin-binding protein [Patescibacteria group bacterium]